MLKTRLIFFLFLAIYCGYGQEAELPGDFRQHNVTQFNTGLFHPAFSLQNKATQSVSFWSRWQWQGIDADPTSLFINYTQLIDNKSVAGVSFFQHNTGVFLNTGGALNYAYSFGLNSNSSLDIGANLFGYTQKLADDRFQQDPQIQISQFGSTNAFVLQFAPGIMYRTGALSLGLLTENLFDYNFRSKQRNSNPRDRVYLGLLSYSFPMEFLNFEDVSLSPTIYYKAVEGNDSQIGLKALFSTNKFWAQSGYNNFYGITVGAGGFLFKKLAVGALIEFATDNNLKDSGPSFEIVTAYRFGLPYKEAEEIEEIYDEGIKEEKRIKQERRQDSINNIQDIQALAELKMAADAAKKAEEKKAIDQTKKVEEKKAAEQKKKLDEQDAADAVKKLEVIKAAEQEKRVEEQKAADAAKKVKEQKAADAAKKVKEQKATDAAKKVKEQKAADAAKKVEEKKAADAAKKAEEQKVADAAKKAEEQKAADAAEKVEEERSIERKKVTEEKKVAQEDPADKPKTGEKFEAVTTADGLDPGYYLIANVFGTKRYFEAFMKDLTDKGLQPKTFFRSLNKYNYVYLKRYDTMTEARNARDSKFEGRYPDKTWIFRVVGK